MKYSEMTPRQRAWARIDHHEFAGVVFALIGRALIVGPVLGTMVGMGVGGAVGLPLTCMAMGGMCGMAWGFWSVDRAVVREMKRREELEV